MRVPSAWQLLDEVLSASRSRRYGEMGLPSIRRYGLPYPCERHSCHHPRPGARRAFDAEPAAERLDAVGEPSQTRAQPLVGAADAIVEDLDDDRVIRVGDADGDRSRVGVLRDVRE